MRRKILILAFASILGLSSLCGVAQSGTLGTLGAFSPYTMYGLGDMAPQGSLSSRLMGGVGLGMRRGDVFNFLNPASLSAIPQHSSIFSFATQGQNIYSQTPFARTSNNSFTIQNLGFAVPLARGLGLGFALTPLSSVGYSSKVIADSPSVVENIGRTIYSYDGEGGISQVSLSLGGQIVTGLSIGATLSYNFGTIDRYYNAQIYPLLENINLRSLYNSEKLNISSLSYNFGVQYAVRVGAEASLTFGLTYSPRVKFNGNLTRLSTTSSSGLIDTVSFATSRYPMKYPEKFAGGVFYMNSKVGVGFDYSNQNWRGAFEMPTDQNMSLRAAQEYKLGVQFTPDRYSIRSQMARWTYKAGLRYGTSYLMRNNYTLRDYSVSFGADIPLKLRSLSVLNAGFEFGQRGAKVPGQVLEQYWRVFVGVSLFSDGWFRRYKFD